MKNVFKLLLLTLFILCLTLGINTFLAKSKQIITEPISSIALQDGFAERLGESLQFPTISNSKKMDTTAFRNHSTFLESLLAPLDFLEVEVINEFSYLLKWEGTNTALKPILLTAHSDVVPVEETSLSQWQAPPFSGDIKDGFIYGRGSMDDKSAVIGWLEAIQVLGKEGFKPSRTLYFAFGHDEEIGGEKGAVSIAKRIKELGLHFEFLLDEGTVVLNDAMPGLSEPVALIGIAEKGYVTLEVKAELEKGGHSSMPPKKTAIGILSEALYHLENKPFPSTIGGVSKEMLEALAPEMDFPYNVLFSNTWLFKSVIAGNFSEKVTTNAMIRTTMAPTVIGGGLKDNILPTEATALINFRILPGETPASVLARVSEIIDHERVKVSYMETGMGGNAPSGISSSNSPAFKTLSKSIREVFPDVVVVPSLVIAATDSRHYEELADDTYRFLPLQIDPIDLQRIHGADERIAVKAYSQMVQFYVQLLKNMNN